MLCSVPHGFNVCCVVSMHVMFVCVCVCVCFVDVYVYVWVWVRDTDCVCVFVASDALSTLLDLYVCSR
jgi:hypothetical protein